MKISWSSDSDGARVRVSGRVDALESPRFRAEMQSHVDAGVAHIIADLTDVDYLDSSGLAVLVRNWRHQTNRGRQFSVVLPSTEHARRIFGLTGFDTVFDIVEPGFEEVSGDAVPGRPSRH